MTSTTRPRATAQHPRASTHAFALVFTLALVGVAAAVPRTSVAQGTPPAGTASAASEGSSAGQLLYGTIRSGGSAVVGAHVLITPVAVRGGAPIGPGRLALTADNGQFRVPGLPTGPVTIVVRRIGFQAVTIDTMAANGPALDIALTPVAQRLAPVVVRERRRGATYSGHLADFNRRRDQGFGRFLTQTDIDSRHALRTSDLLRMIPGMNVVPNGPVNSLRIRNSGCDPLVWLDGMPALSGYLDVDAFDPSSLAGIEIYSGPATVPVELRGGRGQESCGVIALWSRLPDLKPRTPKHVYTAADLEQLVEAATVYTADQVDRPAHLDSTATLAVTYPDSLRNTHTAGEATVEFVVDTAGAVEAGTIGVVAASHPGFADAARLAATDAHFVPAERAGHTVRQLVQLPLRWQPGR